MKNKLFAVETGDCWEDISVNYFVNLTDRSGEELLSEWRERDGGTRLLFRDWVIQNGYARVPDKSEFEVCYN